MSLPLGGSRLGPMVFGPSPHPKPHLDWFSRLAPVTVVCTSDTQTDTHLLTSKLTTEP